MWVVKTSSKVELALQPGQLGRSAAVFVEDLKRDRAVGDRGVVRPVYGRISAVAKRHIHDVSLKALARSKHFLRSLTQLSSKH